MIRYDLHTIDGAASTIEAADFTVGDGMLVFRDVAGLALVAVPIARVVRIDAAYDDTDELLNARRDLASAQRTAELDAIRSTLAGTNGSGRAKQRR